MMCIGVAMKVLEPGFGEALCQARDGAPEVVDTALVGSVQPGEWVMVFLGAAREIIDADTAEASSNAIEALRLAMRGETDVDHLFADLVNREPELPEFLRSPNPTKPERP